MAEHDREPDVRYSFDHDPHASRHARQHLDPLFDDPDDVIANAVRLATSEMVTNVIQHTDGGGEMRAWDPRPDVPFRVEVQDGDTTPPQIPDQLPPVGGRGVAIVAAVADDWGVEPTTDGKFVWAEFDRNKHQPPQPPQP